MFRFYTTNRLCTCHNMFVPGPALVGGTSAAWDVALTDEEIEDLWLRRKEPKDIRPEHLLCDTISK